MFRIIKETKIEGWVDQRTEVEKWRELNEIENDWRKADTFIPEDWLVDVSQLGV